MAAHILVLVENLSVPFDRRVWQESTALVDAGHRVTVICPMGSKQDQDPDVTIEGVQILRYPLRGATGRPRSYAREYSVALWHTMRIAIRIRRESTVDVVHACNPPDVLFLVALLLRPTGSRFVFDQHDLVPELYESRFARGSGILYWMTRVVERLTFATADYATSANQSYRRFAIERGKMRPERVSVVRSAPDLSRFVRRHPDPNLRHGKRYLAAYLGVMGPQDGVEYALRALAHLRYGIGREDVHCTFMGAGDAFDDMAALRDELGLTDMVEFTGRVSDDFVQQCLSTADVCLSPDLPNPFTDVSTMNKVVEYMAMARPIVSFELSETRASAGESALYVGGTDVVAFASAIDERLDGSERRNRMGCVGRERVERELSWDTSRRNLLDFYAGVPRWQTMNGPVAKRFWMSEGVAIATALQCRR